MNKLKQHRGTLLRVGITVLGLWLAAQSIQVGQVAALLAESDWRWVLLGFGLVNISLVLRAYRWLVLLRGLGVQRLSLGRLVALYFIGNFFNAFLPSGFGGDAVRVVEVAQEVGGDVAAGTVFLDRFTGLLVLFVMGLFALPFRPPTFPEPWAITIGVLCAGGLGAGAVLLNGRFLRWLGHKLPLPRLLSPVGDGPVARFLQAVQGCGWPAIGRALAISLLFNGLLVGWWTAATHALGHPVSYGYNTLVVPIFAVALMAPSIGGLGVREALAVPLLAGAGLGADTAVAISLLEFLLLRGVGLLGAPVYAYTIWRKRHPQGPE